MRIIGSATVGPALAPDLSNWGSTRSLGLKFGVSELATFSESTRCRS